MIRAATAADAAAIAALWNHIIRNTTITFASTLKTETGIAQIIADPARLVHVAHQNDMFAGFALVGPFRGGAGYAHTVEHTVHVHIAGQGAGIGTGLMHAIEAGAIIAGHHVMVGGLNGTNKTAIEFHKAIGFQQVGMIAQAGRKNGKWHDLVLMQKILQNAR